MRSLLLTLMLLMASCAGYEFGTGLTVSTSASPGSSEGDSSEEETGEPPTTDPMDGSETTISGTTEPVDPQTTSGTTEVPMPETSANESTSTGTTEVPGDTTSLDPSTSESGDTDASTGEPLPTCDNDGVKEEDEECDGTDLGGATCVSVTQDKVGTLKCNDDCTFDTGFCMLCGNGTLDEDEVCDQGNGCAPGQMCIQMGPNLGTCQGFIGCSDVMPCPEGYSFTCDDGQCMAAEPDLCNIIYKPGQTPRGKCTTDCILSP